MARILIADDEELERRALRLIVESAGLDGGCDVLEARNGQEAADLALHDPQGLDLAFLDIKMPGMDGLAAAQAMRDGGFSSPIVILSAYDTFEYAQKAIRLGVYEYLLKPASSEEVLRALKRSLAWSRDSEENFRRSSSSLLALSRAARSLERAVLSQLREGSLSGLPIRDYERLRSLDADTKSVLIFRLGSGQAHGALFDAAIRGAGEAASGLTTLSAVGRESASMILYGVEAESGNTAGARPGIQGFARTLAQDPLRSFVEGARQALAAISPTILLCGLAGPARRPTEALFASAMEAAGLASPDCPCIRLGRADPVGGDEMLRYDSADSGHRSLGLRALDYIKDSYRSDIGLASAAEALGVNPYHLSHAVAKELGIGFSELLSRVRINRAKEILAGGGSAKEASWLVGIPDQAYFTRVFKRLEGKTPRRFIEDSAKKYKY
ncbi:MAG TPA: response regulator [Rectinemataceae bacterium]